MTDFVFDINDWPWKWGIPGFKCSLRVTVRTNFSARLGRYRTLDCTQATRDSWLQILNGLAWIGFVGKILPGNHRYTIYWKPWVFPMKYGAFRFIFSQQKRNEIRSSEALNVHRSSQHWALSPWCIPLRPCHLVKRYSEGTGVPMGTPVIIWLVVWNIFYFPIYWE